MKNVLSLFASFCFLFLLSSCESDFDMNADWKDIAVVYGLLNQADSVHYVRINKAYLGDGNALVMAKKFDSINYPKDLLEVKLEEYTIGSTTPQMTYMLQWDTLRKQEGLFYDTENPVQTVYKTNAQLNQNYFYKLVITNLKTGNKIYSQTPLIYNSDFYVSKPMSSDRITFLGRQEVKWNTARNGRSYQFLIRFHYEEINKTTAEVKHRYFDWLFPKITVENLNGGKELKYEYVAEQFFINLASAPDMIADNNLKRKPGIVEFIFTVAADEFNTYVEINKPSNSIVQERPLYTNVSNGIGIFSSRYTYIRTLTTFQARSLDSLISGRYTKNFGFFNPYNP